MRVGAVAVVRSACLLGVALLGVSTLPGCSSDGEEPLAVTEELWDLDTGRRVRVLATSEDDTGLPVPDVAVLTLEVDGPDQSLTVDDIGPLGRTHRMAVPLPDGHRMVAATVASTDDGPSVLGLARVGAGTVLSRWDGDGEPDRVEVDVSLPGDLAPVDLGGYDGEQVVIAGEDEDRTLFVCDVRARDLGCDDGVALATDEGSLGRVPGPDGEMTWLTLDGTVLRHWSQQPSGEWQADELDMADEVSTPDLGGGPFDRIHEVAIALLAEERALVALAAEVAGAEQLVVGSLHLDDLEWQGHTILSVDSFDAIEWLDFGQGLTDDGEMGFAWLFEKRALTDQPVVRRVDPPFPVEDDSAVLDDETFASMSLTEVALSPLRPCPGPGDVLEELPSYRALLTTCEVGGLTVWGTYRDGAQSDEGTAPFRDALDASGPEPLLPDLGDVALAPDGVWVPTDGAGHAAHFSTGSDIPALEQIQYGTAAGRPFDPFVNTTGTLFIGTRPTAVGPVSRGAAHRSLTVDDWVFELPTTGADRPGWWARAPGDRAQPATFRAPPTEVCVRGATAAVVGGDVDDEVEVWVTTSGEHAFRTEMTEVAVEGDDVEGCLLDEDGRVHLLDDHLQLRAVARDGTRGPAVDLGLDHRCTGLVELRGLPEGGSVALWDDRCDEDDRLRLARLDPAEGLGPSRAVGSHLAASGDVDITWAGCALAIVSRGQLARVDLEGEECAHA